jgi:hypothetical protein
MIRQFEKFYNEIMQEIHGVFPSFEMEEQEFKNLWRIKYISIANFSALAKLFSPSAAATPMSLSDYKESCEDAVLFYSSVLEDVYKDYSPLYCDLHVYVQVVYFDSYTYK